MTLSSTTSRVSYAGNGVTTVFSFPYKFLANADLVVIDKVDSTGVETVKTLTTHYTVTGAGENSGGSVTMLVAPASGHTLTIYRDPAITQDLDLVENDALPAEELEERLDKLTMFSQRADNRLDRAVTLSEGFTDTFDPTLPTAMTPDRALVVNSDGDGWDIGPSVSEIEDAATNATDAAASASAASSSATLASQWATLTTALVAATDNSSKAWAIGGTGAGQPSAGPAKDWATKTSSNVDGSDYSAKEWAKGTQTRGAASGGSAKDWATYTGGTVDDTEYSAKHYADVASAAAAAGIGIASRFLTFADSPVTVSQTDQGKLLICDCTGGAIVINLPAISGLTLTNPFMMGIKKSDTSSNTVTVNRGGSDTFDNADTAKTIRSPGGGAFLAPSTVPATDVWSWFEVGGSSGSGGGSALTWVEDVDSPTPSVENSIAIYSFDAGLGQDLYALVKVPSSYLAGQQIKMRLPFYSNDTSGDGLLQTIATLIRKQTDQMSSTTNQRTSTNSAVTFSGATQNEPQEVIFDLSSTTGQINSVSISAGDYIKVQLTRGTDTATSVLKVPVYGAEVTFNG